MKTKLDIRGFLLHLSHYDPFWNRENWREKYPFDLTVGLELLDEMAAAGLNTLIVDCEDALLFKSHLELARAYTVPMSQLEQLVSHAETKDIEVIPKLNFSQSLYYCHNDWMRPHNLWDDKKDMFDSDEYWRIAFELIDELCSICRPRHFHIGMDEDDARSFRLFTKAINILESGLTKRNLTTVMWRDSRLDLRGESFSEKHNAAENEISKKIIPVIWKYDKNIPVETMRHIIGKGFSLWGATGENVAPEVAAAWKTQLLENGAAGLILTKWIPCHAVNRTALVSFIRSLGPCIC